MEPTLSVNVFIPVATSVARVPVAEELVGHPDKWTHTSQADGGFWSARLVLSADHLAAEDWLANGLARHVEARSGGMIVWEGFANLISIRVGAATVSIGPLSDLANKVKASYRTISINVTPPIPSYPAATAFAEDDNSQERYGILEAYLSLGETTSSLATQARDVYLSEHTNPRPTSDIAISGGSPVQIEVDFLGYVHYLKRYAYNQTASSSAITIPAKIQAILAANPNAGFFSANYGRWASNATPVTQYENDNQMALEIINDHVAKGDSSNNRYLFGVYGNAETRYEIVPSGSSQANVSYYHIYREGAYALTDAGGAPIPAWEMLPGKWIQRPDFLIGRDARPSILEDLRSEFIESLTFTTPDQININGNRVYRLPQLLARMGLGGM